MIPLRTFNPRALEGARVALVDPEAPTERWEWIGDTLIAQLTPYKWERINGIVERLLLDPTDPDTARLIDQRIAEALPANRHGAVQAAALFPLDKSDNGPCWRLSVLYGVGFRHWAMLTPPGPLDDLDPTEANLSEARARLLQALYPPVAA